MKMHHLEDQAQSGEARQSRPPVSKRILRTGSDTFSALPPSSALPLSLQASAGRLPRLYRLQGHLRRYLGRPLGPAVV